MAARGRGRPRIHPVKESEPTNTAEAPEKAASPLVITDIAIPPPQDNDHVAPGAESFPENVQDAVEREMARMMAERQAVAAAAPAVPVDDDGNPDPNHTGNYYGPDDEPEDFGLGDEDDEEAPGDYHEYTHDETIELITDALRGTAASWRTQAKEEDIKGAANQTLIARLNWGATQFEEFAAVVAMLPPGYTVEEVPEVAASEE